MQRYLSIKELIMKVTIKLLTIVLTISAFAQGGLAYIFSFSNHTPETLAIKIQLGGVNEPWYYLGPDPYKTKGPEGTYQLVPPPGPNGTMLKPNQTMEFRFVVGDEGEHSDYSRKFGFCLAKIQFARKMEMPQITEEPAEEPTEEPELTDAAKETTKKACKGTSCKMKVLEIKPAPNDQWTAWRAIFPYFVESHAYSKIVDASKLVVMGSLEAAGNALQSIGKVVSSSPLEPETQAAGKIAQGVGKSISEASVPIGNVVEGVGTLITYSLCRDRHFDIVEGTDKTGELPRIEFITIAE
jgi:hypothetical protein